MTESAQKSAPFRFRLYAGLAMGVTIGVALNIVRYFLLASPSAAEAAGFHIVQSHSLGIPMTFWVEHHDGTESLDWFAVIFDALATLAIGVGFALWFQKRAEPAERKVNDSLPGEVGVATTTQKLPPVMTRATHWILLAGLALCVLCALFPPRRLNHGSFELDARWGVGEGMPVLPHVFLFSPEFGLYRAWGMVIPAEVDSGMLLADLVLIGSLTSGVILIRSLTP